MTEINRYDSPLYECVERELCAREKNLAGVKSTVFGTILTAYAKAGMGERVYAIIEKEICERERKYALLAAASSTTTTNDNNNNDNNPTLSSLYSLSTYSFRSLRATVFSFSLHARYASSPIFALVARELLRREYDKTIIAKSSKLNNNSNSGNVTSGLYDLSCFDIARVMSAYAVAMRACPEQQACALAVFAMMEREIERRTLRPFSPKPIAELVNAYALAGMPIPAVFSTLAHTLALDSAKMLVKYSVVMSIPFPTANKNKFLAELMRSAMEMYSKRK
jgi:hypothetical protein